MRFYEFICYNGTELAFGDRTGSYIRNGLGPPPAQAGDVFNCSLLRDGDVYVDPATDDAPWYDPSISESEDFLGILPSRIDLLSVNRRTSTPRLKGGGVVGPLIPKTRVLQFVGTMIASDALGMAYGQRWVEEVLAGSRCFGPSRDEIVLLPACPSGNSDAIADEYLRRVLDVGTVDGPVFTQIGNLPECYVQQVTFQIEGGQSYLFSPDIACVTDEQLPSPVGDPLCCKISTNEWPGDAVANITITPTEDATNIVLTGSPTFDDTCPAAEGMPCWKVTIPALEKNAILEIDSVRREIRYTKPSLKLPRSGLHLLEFEGPLTFPEISPCSTFCVCGTAETGAPNITITKTIREF